MQEDSKWLNDFIRKSMLEKNGTMAEIRVYGTDRRRHFPGAAFICTIWKEEKERGYLYWLSDADEISFGKYRSRFSGQRKKQAVEIINGLYLLDVENRSPVEQEILQAELKIRF